MGAPPNLRPALEAAFQENFESRGEVGASVSIWCKGEEWLTLHGGHRDRAKSQDWDADTIVPFWSATKGLAATAVLTALHEKGLDLNTPVREIWPELSLAMDGVTLWQLLSHQAGLAALDKAASIQDHDAVIQSLQTQSAAPNWLPGEAHGYHPRTFGFLAEELVRRLTDAASLGEYWQERIAHPLGLDLWIGLPPEHDERVAELLASRTGPSEASRKFYESFNDPNSLSRRSFGSPRGLAAVSDMNKPENWRLGLGSMGGIGSASSLAKFYMILAQEGRWQGQQVIPNTVWESAQTHLSNGSDRVLLMDTAFSAGFMKDPVDRADSSSPTKTRALMGPSMLAFGHPGAGGSHAFADPERGLGFAYVMNQMELSVLPTQKAQVLVKALYSALETAK